MAKKYEILNLKQKAFQKAMLSSLKFRWFLLRNLPSVLFWGIKITQLDEKSCKVILPYSYRSKNPFGSIYFAALAGAAELASGALCLLHLKDGNKRYSTLVTGVEGEFLKKAYKEVTFTCDEGEKIESLKSNLAQLGETATVSLSVIGANPEGETVARFTILWSFKVKA